MSFSEFVNRAANRARDYLEPPENREIRQKISSLLDTAKIITTIICVVSGVFAALALFTLNPFLIIFTGLPLAFCAVIASDVYKSADNIKKINENVITNVLARCYTMEQQHALIFEDTLLLKHIFKYKSDQLLEYDGI